MDKCRAELTISAEFLEHNVVELMIVQGEVVGFYSLERVSDDVVELGHLFIEPGLLRRGYGGRLLEHAAQKALDLGFVVLRIQGDPHAEQFYQSFGARRVGTQPSASIPGRELPLFELELRGDRVK